jgi:hypothetical protein
MFRRLLAAGLAGPLLAAVAAAAAAQAEYPPPPPTTSGEATPPQPVQMPDRAGRANVQNAASAPLHDLNLTRTKIPPALRAAVADPYAPPRPLNCPTIAQGVADLDDTLGEDLDAPPPGEQTMAQKGGALSLSLMHTAAELLLPYSGFVRTLSGAEKHDQAVIRAVVAGSVRRGYLKGLGEAYRCYPPAAPRRLVRVAAPGPSPDERGRPEYPIR